MTTHRNQHLIPGSIVLILAATVVFLSFTREPASAFLFPRMVSSVMLVLAVWNFLRAVRGLSRVGTGLSSSILMAIVPGALVLCVFVFFAAKALGFYVASFVAFFLILTLYDPDTHLRAWMKRVVVSFLFMVVIYALFSLLLKVQTPRGILF